MNTNPSTVTIFRSIQATFEPYHISLNKALNRIKDGRSKAAVELVRTTTDPEAKKEAKKNLPCLLFAGIFSQRKADACDQHTGHLVLDFDDVNNPEELKQYLKGFDWISAGWISPSATGVKALARIPAKKELHRQAFEQIAEELEAAGLVLDQSGKDLSRICFESYDPELWYREGVEFEVKQVVKKVVKTAAQSGRNSQRHYDQITRMLREARDGEHHQARVRAGRLAGGFIAAGLLDEYTALNICEDDARSRANSDRDIKQALKTFSDMIAVGKLQPVDDIVAEQQVEIEIAKSITSAKQWLEDIFTIPEMGKGVGIRGLDKHWLFKANQFHMILARSNDGKTFWTLWWLSCLVKNHGHKFIVYSFENSTRWIKTILMKFFTGGYGSEDRQLAAAEVLSEHFRIIDVETSVWDTPKILRYTQMLIDNGFKADAIMVDPLNALTDTTAYDAMVESMRRVQIFCRTVTGIVATSHPSTGDARRGGKITMLESVLFGQTMVSKIHNGMILNRDGYQTDILVRKVKEEDTGGQKTPHDEPVEMTYHTNPFGFIMRDSYEAKGDTESPFN